VKRQPQIESANPVLTVTDSRGYTLSRKLTSGERITLSYRVEANRPPMPIRLSYRHTRATTPDTIFTILDSLGLNTNLEDRS